MEICTHGKSDICKSSGIYGLGFIGAATSFWGGVVGVLKALVWPAFLVYEALKFLGQL